MISVSVTTPKALVEVDTIGTQCESYVPQYTEAATQTDPDDDYLDRTAVLREVRLRHSLGIGPSPPPVTPPPPTPPELIDTACGPSTIDLIYPMEVPKPITPPQREVTPPLLYKPIASTSRGVSRAQSRAQSRARSRKTSERRKLKSRGMTLHTAMRATSGRKSLSSSKGSRPPSKSKVTAKKSPPTYRRSMKGKPPVEKWHIAAERIYMQQRQRRVKPAKSDKLVLGLKTAISELKSFTTPPPAVYDVTKAVLIIIGEKRKH